MPFFEGARGQLHYRRWAVPRPLAMVQWLPGTGQHSGHYHRFARGLGARGLEVWGLDTSGQGLSEGDPQAPGTLDELVADARAFALAIRRESPGIPLVVAGHSLGAATAVAMVSGTTGSDLGYAAMVLTGTPKRATAGYPALPPDLPVLALHGVDDRRAPIDSVRDWTARGQSVGLREYADAGHDLLHEPVHAKVTADIVEWIRDVVVERGARRVE
ncbi:alpha/beta hydrolase [Nocardia alni]|uniref:alpha/beta hydrolase n=1 Tax=Nocardia alni TaxID=2815723 RepID=UPI001C2217CC|nr:alpha/beta hydrolase [Nocardia alni]